jgi:diguanylate cyclase (GGDEF)-like protein
VIELSNVLRNVNVGAFCLLALACVYQWRKRGDASLRWATIAFGSLATISVIGLIMRQLPTWSWSHWAIRGLLVVLILFPYFLYRFATTFERVRTRTTWIAHGATAVVVIASVALPHLPLPGAPEPGWWTAYRAAVITQWTILFAIVALRLWGAGRDEATVARRRMRTLALATGGLNCAILLSGVGPSPTSMTITVITQALSLASAILFFIGLAPPTLLVDVWRKPEERAFQATMTDLFRAETQIELCAVLLPRAAGLVGARGVALVTEDRTVLGRYGVIGTDDDVLRVFDLPGCAGVHRIDFGSGSLLLWTSPYAPLFAAFGIMEALGAFVDIVLERCSLAEQQKQAEAALAYQATHDHLTGLPNRTLLEDRVALALARGRRRAHTTVAVLFLDVDRFKVINDSLGHALGDEVLRAIATRLQGIVRPDDTVARFGGDEFVIVTEGLTPEPGPVALAARIADAMSAPIVIGSTEVVAAVSIGVALAGPDDDAGSLLRDADAAMYRAKEQGRGCCVVFDSAMRTRANSRLETETALRRALEQDELRVHYQPTLDLASGDVVGVEALARWQHDDQTILPGEFIPLAEETGLIIALGAAVLRQACRQVATWQRELPGMEQLSLAVNLSSKQLLTPGVVDEVRGALLTSGLDPDRLCLEVTETTLMDDADSSARALASLKSLGVRIGVDDFGTGFSSLTFLKRFRVDTLKIDRSCVDSLASEVRGERIMLANIIDLAHACGLTTVAEGVETAEQLGQVHALGCQLAQGYHLSLPLPPAEIPSWIREVMAEPGAETRAPARLSAPSSF